MRTSLVVLFLLSHTASLAAAADSVRCAKLRDEFDMADRQIARISAESVADNSAPRETNRQLKMLRATLNKSMAVQLLIAAKCDSLPLAADSSSDYLLSAKLCQAKRGGANYVTDSAASACDMAGWERHPGMPESTVIGSSLRVPDSPGAHSAPDSACQVPPCYAPLPTK